MTKIEVNKEIVKQIDFHIKKRNLKTANALSWSLMQTWTRENLELIINELNDDKYNGDLKAYNRLKAIDSIYSMLFL